MMRRCLCMLLAVVVLAGCRQESVGVAQNSGQQIYMARCAVCHGENREGRPGMYPPLAGSQLVDGPPDRITAIVLDGLQGRVGDYNAVMPGWGSTLRDTDIASVITWLRQRDGKTPVTAVDVNHTRVTTTGRNTFWTMEDLQNLPAN